MKLFLILITTILISIDEEEFITTKHHDKNHDIGKHDHRPDNNVLTV